MFKRLELYGNQHIFLDLRRIVAVSGWTLNDQRLLYIDGFLSEDNEWRGKLWVMDSQLNRDVLQQFGVLLLVKTSLDNDCKN